MGTVSHQKKIQHFYLRSGFGGNASEIDISLNKSLHQIADEVFENSRSFTDLSLKGKGSNNTNGNIRKFKGLPNDERIILKKQSRDDIKELNINWISKLSGDRSQLREKMTLFWHGHFACRTKDGTFCLNQNNLLRKNSLGKFGKLLKGISEDPAMLQFLNNQQNKKSSPNENFAREVMELFTLGRGYYSETDIKESARAFTGWSFNKDGEFVFRRGVHDFGEKTFFGKTGNYSGEDIIDIILENRRTAEFITEKIYKYFVNEEINKEITDDLAGKFYESEYDIEQLMKNIFYSDWFYDKENIGKKIKSPVELLVGIIRSFNVDFKNPVQLLAIQKFLGQILFNPPNVAGWQGGRSWIDSSSLVFRLKLPEIIFKSSGIQFDYKEYRQENDNDKNDITDIEINQIKRMNTNADLSKHIIEFSKYDESELPGKLSEYLLQTNLDSETKSVIEDYADDSAKEKFIESLTLRLISLPEYQLC